MPAKIFQIIADVVIMIAEKIYDHTKNKEKKP